MTESANPLLSFSSHSLAGASSGISLTESQQQGAPSQGFSALYARFADNADGSGLVLDPTKVPVATDVYATANHWQAGKGLQSQGSLLPPVSAQITQTADDATYVDGVAESVPAEASQGWSVPPLMQVSAPIDTTANAVGNTTAQSAGNGQQAPISQVAQHSASSLNTISTAIKGPYATTNGHVGAAAAGASGEQQPLVTDRDQAKVAAGNGFLASSQTAAAGGDMDSLTTGSASLTATGSALAGQGVGPAAGLVGQQAIARLAGMKATGNDAAAVSVSDVSASSVAALQADAGRAQANAAYTASSVQPATQGSLNMMQPSWGEAVVQRVMWLSAQGLKSAEIALDPPELGALQVRISTQHDQATVSFTSPNAQVRESLDQNMPRLREMLDQQGLSLADSNVADQGRSEHADEQEQGPDAGVTLGAEESEALTASNDKQQATRALSLGVGIIDHYA